MAFYSCKIETIFANEKMSKNVSIGELFFFRIVSQIIIILLELLIQFIFSILAGTLNYSELASFQKDLKFINLMKSC